MIIELLLPSLIAGILIAIPAGSLGCFVVWRRMAFFSDALAHSAIIGTALALISQVNPLYGLLGFGTLIALIMARFENGLQYSGDTLLAILAQISLAFGLIFLSYSDQPFNLEALLFGDILSVTWTNIAVIGSIATGLIILIITHWKGLVDTSLDEELAAIEGIHVMRHKLVLFLSLVALIAIAVKMVGVLLISSLLLIPAATMRIVSNTPLQMVLLAPCLGVIATITGILLAWQLDWPTGPSIVAVLASFWLLSQLSPIKEI